MHLHLHALCAPSRFEQQDRWTNAHELELEGDRLAEVGGEIHARTNGDRVQPIETQFAGKLYAPNVYAASVGGEGGWLDFAWQGIDHLGIWLAYGGWPAPGGRHQIALEPTTAPVDHLGDALNSGMAISLDPGGKRSWQVSLTLRAGNS